MPAPLYSIVPVPAVKVPPVPDKGVRLDKDILLEPPFNVPAVLVHTPEKVCVNPEPKFKVPPVPFMVKPAPFIFPVKVAVPPVFVMEIKPVVVKPPIDWLAVPDIVIPPDPLVKVPLFTKFPVKLISLVPGVNVAPEAISKVSTVMDAPNEVVPPFIVNLLNEVKVDAGSVFVVTNSTVPFPAVKIFPAFAKATAKELAISFPPLVISIFPNLLLPPET